MDKLTLFGLFAVIAMLVCYALENRSTWFILAFAGACVLGSVYGFLQGAWPFGLVEAVWSVVALYRWRSSVRGCRFAGQSSPGIQSLERLIWLRCRWGRRRPAVESRRGRPGGPAGRRRWESRRS